MDRSDIFVYRANPNYGLLPGTIHGPGGTWVVVPVGPSIMPADPRGDTVCWLLQERDEARAWYSNATRDLGWMDFHLNALQDALTIP